MAKDEGKKDLIIKSFQVTGITCTDSVVVHNDAVLKRAIEAAQSDLNLEEEEDSEDGLNEDPFADIELDNQLCLHYTLYMYNDCII